MTRRRRNDGMTLTEVLIASAIALVVVLGIGATDVLRVRVSESIRELTGVSALDQRKNAAFAMLQMAKRLERADRVNLVSADNMQVRIPLGTAFDAAANYRWDQYRYDLATRRVLFFSDTAAACPAARPVAWQISALTFTYVDEGSPPPGVEPFSPATTDNNVLAYELDWDDGRGRTHVFRSEVTRRVGAYADVNASGGDSGTGLAPAGVSDPPGAC